MILEQARREDWAEINRLAQQVQAMHAAWRPEIYAKTEQPMPLARLKAYLKQESLYVVREGEKLLAYAVAVIRMQEGPVWTSRQVLDLQELCVDEPLRGQGMGRELLGALEQLARDLGCTDLQLCCDPQNQAAMALYESLGMSVTKLQYRKTL